MASGDFRRRLEGTGFVIATEVPHEEIVIGVAGRLWQPDGGRCLETYCGWFFRVLSPGFAKAAWNLKLRGESPRSTVLSMETKDEVLRLGGVVEISRLLESGSPLLRTLAHGDSEENQERGGISCRRGFLKEIPGQSP